jgi:predicted transcriptional regulator
MELQLSAERQAQLTDYAQRHGQEPAVALGEILADALEAERQEYQEAIEGIRGGYADVQAGRTRPASEFMNELRASETVSQPR